MAYDYDVAVVGLGPAGMAVSIMASAMDLKVIAVEAHKIGGECMNVGCIPSKALLRAAAARHVLGELPKFGMTAQPPPPVQDLFARIQQHLDFIGSQKTRAMFAKVELVLGEGAARFEDAHTLQAGTRRFTARRIFLCTGTRPAIPPIPGIEQIAVLTNENMFALEAVPESLLVIGSGAIACEMAQGFARLGARVTMVMRGEGLLWREDPEGSALLTRTFEAEGIRVLTRRQMERVEADGNAVVLHTREDGPLRAARLLSATGRRMDFQALQLDRAGVAATEKGITVNARLQTSRRHIYACGDCNGHAQLSHAAMHQGMIALINSMTPWPFRRDFRAFPVPWTIFTEPAFSQVGAREEELKKRGTRYEVITVRYEDYGAAIAENLGPGFLRALVSPLGRVYGMTIVGHVSGELINEWTTIIQNRIRLHQVLFQMHSFPTMGFLSKRIAETWMMRRMKSAPLRRMAAAMYRLMP
jgi:pyruvate/2-oxoglutarate dehydrogenase complex dihydrolipoamide dehydrogenase (E3) component